MERELPQEFITAYKEFQTYIKNNSKKIATLQLTAKIENFLRDEFICILSDHYKDKLVASNFGNKRKYDICVIDEDKKEIELLIECKYFTNRCRWWGITDGTNPQAAKALTKQLDSASEIRFKSESYEVTYSSPKPQNPLGIFFISYVAGKGFPDLKTKNNTLQKFTNHIKGLIADDNKREYFFETVDIYQNPLEITRCNKKYEVNLVVGLVKC